MRDPKRLKFFQSDVWVGLLLSLVAFLVYLSTLAPSVLPMDSGELAVVASTLGIAHPTGYPLFTLLGWVFAHLPIGGRIIWKLNLMSAVLCSIAVFFFYQLFLRLLLNKSAVAGSVREASARIASASAALILAFSGTFWSQALSVEVYPLHLLFLSLLILLFVRSVLENPHSNRLWHLFALILGLSFTNHMTTILLAPGFLYLFFATQGFSRASWIKIAMAAIPFLIGLSLYLYLPLRAAQHPLMNWGNPVTLQEVWWHVTGKQYHAAMFASFDTAEGHLQHFFRTYPSEFGYVPLFFAFIGLVGLFRRFKRMLVFSALLFFCCLAYSSNYGITDIDSYYLLAYVTTGIWIAYGIYFSLEIMRGKMLLRFARILCLMLVFSPLCVHYRAIDESRDYAVEDYVRNVFDSVDSGAIIFSDQGPQFTMPAYYLQLVEGMRPDVTVIDKSFLESAWYFPQLEQRYPWLVENSRSEVETAIREMNAFDRGLNSGMLLKSRFISVAQSFIGTNYGKRPVYATPEVSPEGYKGVASGLVLRLFRDTNVAILPVKEFSFRPLPDGNHLFVGEIKADYATSYVNQGVDRAILGDMKTAEILFRKALKVKPGFPSALEYLDRLRFSQP